MSHIYYSVIPDQITGLFNYSRSDVKLLWLYTSSALGSHPSDVCIPSFPNLALKLQNRKASPTSERMTAIPDSEPELSMAILPFRCKLLSHPGLKMHGGSISMQSPLGLPQQHGDCQMCPSRVTLIMFAPIVLYQVLLAEWCSLDGLSVNISTAVRCNSNKSTTA